MHYLNNRIEGSKAPASSVRAEVLALLKKDMPDSFLMVDPAKAGDNPDMAEYYADHPGIAGQELVVNNFGVYLKDFTNDRNGLVKLVGGYCDPDRFVGWLGVITDMDGELQHLNFDADLELTAPAMPHSVVAWMVAFGSSVWMKEFSIKDWDVSEPVNFANLYVQMETVKILAYLLGNVSAEQGYITDFGQAIPAD